MNDTLYIVTGVKRNPKDMSIDLKILGVFKDKDKANNLRDLIQRNYYKYEGWNIDIEIVETDLI